MKIAILTQPLHTNYGGLLQAYALQAILKNMEHEVLTVNIQGRRTIYNDFKYLVYQGIRKYILKRKNVNSLLPIRPTCYEDNIIRQYTNRFINKNIQTTEKISLVEQIDVLKKYNFEAYIVGSDQVWRPKYSPGLQTFFLDFLSDDKKTKRIAYAASFGVDYWELSPKLTKKCEKLAKKFDAISVREDSAVLLCNKYLKVNAIQSMDPTMLLDKEDYISLIKQDTIPYKKNSLMSYALDENPYSEKLINEISKQLNLTINSVMPIKKYSKDARKNIDECIFPPVTEWLKGFMDAEFIITDSYHGTIFSILFNKQFITIGNESRGLARFLSLLKIFNLEERLILPDKSESLNTLINTFIDYEEINRIREVKKNESLDFIYKSLLIN